MGNTQSNIVERLDDIATEYILDADFQTLSKMKDKDYCNKVTIVTKEILDKQFDHLDIEYLARRAKNGWDVSSLFQNPFAAAKKKNSTPKSHEPGATPAEEEEEEEEEELPVTYPTKENVGYITTIENPNKEAMCFSISTFYVKIGHIFAAIVGTIRPKYVFQDGKESYIMTPKSELPSEPDTAVFQLAENGFCFQKIEALKRGTYKDPSVVNPQFCQATTNENTAKGIPGVPEFEMLYYDETDPQGNPTMSDKNMIAYRKDLATFYTKFTGNPSLPNDLHRFSDIPLKAPNETEERCQNNTYNQPIKPINSERENPLFQDYANNLREMIQVTGDLQRKLVDILNRLFTKKQEGKKITIQPKLTLADLDKMIVETRNVLLELFLRCEEYFENGVNIYKAIVDDRIINHTFEEFLLPDTLVPPPPPSTVDFLKTSSPSTTREITTADFMKEQESPQEESPLYASEDDGFLTEQPEPEPPFPLPPSSEEATMPKRDFAMDGDLDLGMPGSFGTEEGRLPELQPPAQPLQPMVVQPAPALPPPPAPAPIAPVPPPMVFQAPPQPPPPTPQPIFFQAPPPAPPAALQQQQQQQPPVGQPGPAQGPPLPLGEVPPVAQPQLQPQPQPQPPPLPPEQKTESASFFPNF